MSSPPSHSPPEIPKFLISSDVSSNNTPPLMKLNLGELSLTNPSSPGRIKSGTLDSNILGVEIGKTTNWTIEKNLEDILLLLGDSFERELFLTYAGENLFEENVEFLLAAKSFRTHYESVLAEAREIWFKFGNKGQKHVNIDHKMSQVVEDSVLESVYTGNISGDTYIGMENYIAKLLVAENNYIAKYQVWKDKRGLTVDGDTTRLQAGSNANKAKKATSKQTTPRGEKLERTRRKEKMSSSSGLTVASEMRSPKLLLLGLSGSGKTTFMNYCRLNYGDLPDQGKGQYQILSDEYLVIYQAACLLEVKEFCKKFEDHTSIACAEDQECIKKSSVLTKPVIESLERIWAEVLREEKDYADFIENEIGKSFSIFIQRCHKLVSSPLNVNEILSVYQPTVSACGFKFPYLCSAIEMIDSPGKTDTEWVELCQQSNYIIYFVNLDDYNNVTPLDAADSFELKQPNKLLRALGCWENLTNYPFAQHLSFHLVFTKSDLMLQKIKKDPISKYFELDKSNNFEVLNPHICNAFAMEYFRTMFTRAYKGNPEQLEVSFQNFSSQRPDVDQNFSSFVHDVYMTIAATPTGSPRVRKDYPESSSTKKYKKAKTSTLQSTVAAKDDDDDHNLKHQLQQQLKSVRYTNKSEANLNSFSLKEAKDFANQLEHGQLIPNTKSLLAFRTVPEENSELERFCSKLDFGGPEPVPNHSMELNFKLKANISDGKLIQSPSSEFLHPESPIDVESPRFLSDDGPGGESPAELLNFALSPRTQSWTGKPNERSVSPNKDKQDNKDKDKDSIRSVQYLNKHSSNPTIGSTPVVNPKTFKKTEGDKPKHTDDSSKKRDEFRERRNNSETSKLPTLPSKPSPDNPKGILTAATTKTSSPNKPEVWSSKPKPIPVKSSHKLDEKKLLFAKVDAVEEPEENFFTNLKSTMSSTLIKK